MNKFDSEGFLVAGIVGYALARALFDEMVGPDRYRIAQKALTYLPPSPDVRGYPTEARIWREVQAELRTLGALPPSP
jgi:hypothetical protein